MIASPQFQTADPVYQYAHSTALVSTILGILLLLVILFVFRNPLSRLSLKILMGLGIVGIPLVTICLGILIGLHKAKKVEFCGSCHRAMKPYVSDMIDIKSDSLAARHYKNLWINHNQCYECHTDYGLLGDFKAKAKGFLDVYHYYFGSWDGEVKLEHPIKNKSCLKCHAYTSGYAVQEIHQSEKTEIYEDRVFCSDCHSPIHKIAQ